MHFRIFYLHKQGMRLDLKISSYINSLHLLLFKLVPVYGKYWKGQCLKPKVQNSFLGFFFNFYITLYQSFSKITRLLRKILFGGLLLYLIHFYQYIFMLKLSSVFSHDLKFSDLNQILSKPLTDNFCRTNEKGGCKINLWPKKNPKQGMMFFTYRMLTI